MKKSKRGYAIRGGGEDKWGSLFGKGLAHWLNVIGKNDSQDVIYCWKLFALQAGMPLMETLVHGMWKYFGQKCGTVGLSRSLV
jgi:hypothetical protein